MLMLTFYFVVGNNFGEGDNGALQGGFGGRPNGFAGQQGGRNPTNLGSILGVRNASDADSA